MRRPLRNSYPAPDTASLYWAFTTISTVGYGDLTPRSAGERLFAIIAMIFGTGIYAYIVGEVSAMVTASSSSERETVMRTKRLREFCNDKGLPPHLQVRIRRYFRFYWNKTLTMDAMEEEFMDKLSTPLRQEVEQPPRRARAHTCDGTQAYNTTLATRS